MKDEGISPICGLWVDDAGTVHLALREEQAKGKEVSCESSPFVWSEASDEVHGGSIDLLEGNERLNTRISFDSITSYKDFIQSRRGRTDTYEVIKPLEHQYLLKNERRMFEGLRFKDLRRLQLDIETACSVEGGFSSARRLKDRVLAIGLRIGDHVELLELKEHSVEDEKQLLELFNERLLALDPDIIEGHNIFNFDLEYLRARLKRYSVPCAWGRFGQDASFRKSRVRIAERWIDFTRCDIPGRTVVDTYILAQMYDLTARALPSYRLKDVAVHLGVTDPQERTYIEGASIQVEFDENRQRFRAYLEDDLRETKGVADLLLPTYVAQVRDFPMLLQEILLRGSAVKLETLFLEKYYKANYSLPAFEPVSSFEGGFTGSFETGVFEHVLHYDVASLYPSLLLHIGDNPKTDKLGIFIPLLKELKEYRLKYKKLARETTDKDLSQEYNARQSSFKILINSFYGYLGFYGARFSDGRLASEVTYQGRELLKKLISGFQDNDCTILEADTDGIYLSSAHYYDQPEALLAKVSHLMPEGIELDYDGRYEAMFCYKAKNYALNEGGKAIIRGSALRSRATEPFLKDLTYVLIDHLLGISSVTPNAQIKELRASLLAQEVGVEQLVKSEYLSQNPDAYKKAIEEGKKPRRASLEVALRQEKTPRMGQKVTYFIGESSKKSTPDWQKAHPQEQYDKVKLPYDPHYYLKKIDAWEKRYEEFIKKEMEQGELF